MIWVVFALVLISFLLLAACVGLHVQLEQAKQDAAAWKAIAIAIDNSYVRVPAITRAAGTEMRH